jgi:Arylsulfotransferase (ASST)
MVAGLLTLSSCAPGWDMVQTDPGLFPIFQSAVTDYVNRCTPNVPTKVTVSAPSGTTVSVAGQPAHSGTFKTSVNQQPNEAFKIVVSSGNTRTAHFVRCLPAGFPQWTADRKGTPQAEFYATVIIKGFSPDNVPVIFDTNGVPVWWSAPQPTFLLAPLRNKDLATMSIGGGMVERRLDGTVARKLNTSGAPSDFHDVLLLPNGHYVMATLDRRPCDLSPWRAPAASTCLFHQFQELTSTGRVVWSWNAESGVPLTETAPEWRSMRDAGGAADPWHYNSVEWTGDGFIISFRHMDAVYKINYATKKVVWKLGGSHRTESLRVLGDPIFRSGGSIAGQHDARLLPGSIVSLFDNGTNHNRAPRSVAYRIDERAHTATMVKQVHDPVAPTSACCGSDRMLPGGDVVTGWGGTPNITENKADGTQVFMLGVKFVYRGIPLLRGWYTRDQLRAAMDAQFNGAVPAHASSVTAASNDAAAGAWARLVDSNTTG